MTFGGVDFECSVDLHACSSFEFDDDIITDGEFLFCIYGEIVSDIDQIGGTQCDIAIYGSVYDKFVATVIGIGTWIGADGIAA